MHSRMISISAIVLSLLVLSGCSGQDKSRSELELRSEGEKFSYTLGLDMGYSIAQFGADINEDALYAGIAARLARKEPLLSKAEQARVKLAVFKRLAKRRADQAKIAAEKKLDIPKRVADIEPVEQPAPATVAGK